MSAMLISQLEFHKKFAQTEVHILNAGLFNSYSFKNGGALHSNNYGRQQGNLVRLTSSNSHPLNSTEFSSARSP